MSACVLHNVLGTVYTAVIHGCIYLDREITCAEVVSLVKERWCAAHPRVRSGIVRKVRFPL